MRRVSLGLLFVVPAVAFACGALEGSDPEPEPTVDGSAPPTADGSPTPSDDGSAPIEDAATDADADAGSGCRVARAPTCAPNACVKRLLHNEIGTFPYAIATDAAHVFWLEGVVGTGLNADPYNGNGQSRLRRGDRDANPAATLATNQTRAAALTLEGTYVYFTTFEQVADAGPFYPRLHRVDANCAAPCAVTDISVTGWSANARMVRLRTAGPNLLLAQQDNGPVHAVKITGTTAQSTMLGNVGTFPGFVLAPPNVYAAGALDPKVAAAKADGLSLFSVLLTLPAEPDAGVGAVLHATDCDAVYGARTFATGKGDGIVRIAIADGGVTHVSKGLGIPVVGLGADERWLYAGGYNGNGIHAVERGDGGRTQIASGGVWDVTVDDLGVYWGDRNVGGNGQIVMMLK